METFGNENILFFLMETFRNEKKRKEKKNIMATFVNVNRGKGISNDKFRNCEQKKKKKNLMANFGNENRKKEFVMVTVGYKNRKKGNSSGSFWK